MKTIDVILEDLDNGEDQYTITPSAPASWRDWRPKDMQDATFITLKAVEARGVPVEVIRSMAFQSVSSATGKTVGPFRAGGVIGVYAPSGHDIISAVKKVGFTRYKPSGIAFAFSPGFDASMAMKAVGKILEAFRAKYERFAQRREKYRADAPKRAKAAAVSRTATYAKERQALYDKYGKNNVLSVTAKQIGGDDGYQWNVLINGSPLVNGLTRSEVPYYKRRAYEILLQKNGKQ